MTTKASSKRGAIHQPHPGTPSRTCPYPQLMVILTACDEIGTPTGDLHPIDIASMPSVHNPLQPTAKGVAFCCRPGFHVGHQWSRRLDSQIKQCQPVCCALRSIQYFYRSHRLPSEANWFAQYRTMHSSFVRTRHGRIAVRSGITILRIKQHLQNGATILLRVSTSSGRFK